LKLSDFLWYNNFAEDKILQPGSEVIVHLAEGQPLPPTPTPIQTHFVRSGQTLWDIALTYNLSLDDLLAYNGLTADSLLQVGQELRVRPLPSPTAPPPATPESQPPSPEPSPTIAAAETRETAVVPPPANPTPSPSPSTALSEISEPENTASANLNIILVITGLVFLAGAFIVAGQRQRL
jgi:LysM repeat protein